MFSQLKAKFKALRARKFMGLIHDSHEELVKKAVKSLKKKDIINCIQHVEKILN